MEECNADWWEGRLKESVGYFPANRVEYLKKNNKKGQVGILFEFTIQEKVSLFNFLHLKFDLSNPFDSSFPGFPLN